MRFEISREQLLKPLMDGSGVVERRQTLPVLSNLLLKLDNSRLEITGTDLEVEVSAVCNDVQGVDGNTTVPARKFLDIVRSFPEESTIRFEVVDNKAICVSGRSRFQLSTLNPNEFPRMTLDDNTEIIEVTGTTLKQLLAKTGFAMAAQDVRYYLNGLLMQMSDNKLTAVATDGHRLAFTKTEISLKPDYNAAVIVPRKGIGELSRLIEEGDQALSIGLGEKHIVVKSGDVTLTSKLIDGKFPDYERVIPGESDNVVMTNRLVLKEALARTAILSNEKYRGVRLCLEPGQLTIQTNNPEQEEAEEKLSVEYTGQAIEIGFNVNYLIDAISAISSEQVRLGFTDAHSSVLIRGTDDEHTLYVVMPMRL